MAHALCIQKSLKFALVLRNRFLILYPVFEKKSGYSSDVCMYLLGGCGPSGLTCLEQRVALGSLLFDGGRRAGQSPHHPGRGQRRVLGRVVAGLMERLTRTARTARPGRLQQTCGRRERCVNHRRVVLRMDCFIAQKFRNGLESNNYACF